MLRRFISHAIVRNALLLYTIQFSSYLLPLITLPYLARVLSPERLGLVAFSQSFVWYFIVLTEYGFSLTATREIAVHREDRERVNRIFSSVMVARALLTLLGLLIMLALIFSIPRIRAHWELFLAAFLMVVGYALFPVWLFQGFQQMGPVALRDFLAKLIATGSLFLLVRDDRDYLMAALTQSGGMVLAGIIGLAMVRTSLGVQFRWPEWNDVREAFRTGWPVFVSMAATTLTAPTNVVIVGLRSSAAEVAYFSNAQRLIVPMRGLVGSVVTAVYPHVSEKAGRSEAEALRFVRKYRWLFSAPFFAGGLLLLIASPWLIPWLLGPKYRESIMLVQILAFSPFLLAVSHTYSTYYMLACGYDKEWMRVILSSVVANFAVVVPLLFLVRGSLAISIAMIFVDVFCVLGYHRFYRKQSATDGQGRPVGPEIDPAVETRDAPLQ